MSSHTSRNEPCSCGSGKKYKNCCGRSPSFLNKGQKKVVGISLLVIAALVAAVMFFGNNQPPLSPAFSPTAAPTGSPATGGVGRPPGSAPAGKVWSFEHGHWHDAPGSTPATQPGVQTFGQPNTGTATFTPQPPGDVPPGKVWSPQHGHWHNAAVNSAGSGP